jgi:hypothetical protein
MAATDDKRPWNIKHHSCVGPVNKGHPQLKGCVIYFDFMKEGNKPTGTGNFYQRQIGASNFEYDSGVGGNINKHGGSMSGGERVYNIWYYTDGGFMPFGSNYIAIKERLPDTLGEIRYNHWTMLIWINVSDQGGTFWMAGLADGDNTNENLYYTTSAAEMRISTIDSSDVSSGSKSTTAIQTGEKHVGLAFRHRGDVEQFRFTNISTDLGIQHQNGSTNTTQSGLIKSTIDQRMWLSTGAFAPTQNPIITQFRFYNRNLSDREIVQCLKNPWAPRSGRRGGHRN